MNFITFPVAATNLWPAANSTAGPQLVTEWNIRSRETVGTDPAVTYSIGPSYVHGEKDFWVSRRTDAGGAVINSYTLQIGEGRALVNGHYVETLAPMFIDLVEANAELAANNEPILKGNLAIGIRAFYSTEQTVAGSILVENENDMYIGIQLVVLPEEELITPSDSPTDQSKVTADLRLATFIFMNNAIQADPENLSSRLQCVYADRIADIDGALAQSKYVTKTGLNSKKIYAFAGKGSNIDPDDPSAIPDTWEDSTDSLIVWDRNYMNPDRMTINPSDLYVSQAELLVDGPARTITDGQSDAVLALPHKQVEGMTDDQGRPQYYKPRLMNIPIANYSSNTTGFVNSEYTRQIKSIATQVSEFRTSLTGKQIYYMEERDVDTELPPINAAWNIGDYILVKSDIYFSGAESDTSGNPSTMYVVLPGQVLTIGYIAQVSGDDSHDAAVPSNVHGVELVAQEWYESSGQDAPNTTNPQYFPEFFSSSDVMLGVPRTSNSVWNDYFRVRYFLDNSNVHAYTDYYYGVATSGPRQWSKAIMVTGAMSLATENEIGGFYDASPDATDYGYVHLDDSGHLVLTDYALLRSGTLAYQIAQHLTIPASDDITEIQSYISEYVNDRIAFPSSGLHNLGTSSILDITITLSSSNEGVLEIAGIDSRFNTAIRLFIKGDGTPNVAINIVDCEKVIIDNDIKGTPTINVFRSCLYYDPVVFEYIRTCDRGSSTFTGFSDLTIWYERFTDEDPNLLVSGMSITELDAQIISTEINYWSELGSAINDNHYLIALKGIEFAGNGDIVGCELLVANNSTDNILPGDKIIVGQFTLPQGSSLIYPTACLARVLKVSGEFTTAYYSDSKWYVTDNSFSVDTGVFSSVLTPSTMTGTAAFHSSTTLISQSIGQTSIDVWDPSSYHVFKGGAII